MENPRSQEIINEFYNSAKRSNLLSEMQESYVSTIRNHDAVLSRRLDNENYSIRNGPCFEED